MDDFNWEVLVIDVDLNIFVYCVVCIVEWLSVERGYLVFICSDNDLEFIVVVFVEWVEWYGVIFDVI